MTPSRASALGALLGLAGSGYAQEGTRTLTLAGAWDGRDATVNLRTIDAGAAALGTEQHASIRETFSIQITQRTALVRARPRGASPVTFLVPEGRSDVRLQLPALAAGGEIFGLLPRHAFLPEALELIGPTATRTLVPDPSGTFEASGLAAGEYTLVPRYRGGLRSPAHRVVVRDGETSELLPLPMAEPGAVTVDVAPEICGSGAQLALRRTRMTDGGTALVLAAELRGPPCRRQLEGVEAGAYEAWLSEAPHARGLLARAALEVAPGKRALVELRPSVYVSGHVTFGDNRPAPAFALEFELGARTWTAVSDADGDYASSVGGPGTYRISVRGSPGLPPVSLARSLRIGTQREDFDLGAGAMNVRVQSEDGAPLHEPVQLALIGAMGRRVEGHWQPDEHEAARFVGLEYDEYRVIATTAGGLSSGSPASVRISAEAPVADVEVLLGSHEGLLRIVDAADKPIPGARAQITSGPLAEQAPGVFTLTGIPFGEPVRAQAPGHVPLCHTLQRQDLPELSLALEPATERVTIHIAAGLTWEAATVADLRGSDCRVAIDAFDLQAHMARDEVTVVLGLSTGSCMLVVDGRSYPVVVPGGDVDVRAPE